MAAATAVVSRRGNDQFRGLFTDTWDVTCTLNSASVATTATATDTVTVSGVALGDMVLGMSIGVDVTQRVQCLGFCDVFNQTAVFKVTIDGHLYFKFSCSNQRDCGF